MIEETKEFFNSLSWGWILTVITGTIVPFVLKLQPVTTLTSTKLERVLLSKEKRLSLKLLEFFFTSIMATFASSGLFTVYYSLYDTTLIKNNTIYFNILLGVLAVASCLGMGFLIFSTTIKRLRQAPHKKRKHLKRRAENKYKRATWILIVMCSFSLTIFSIIPASIAYEVVNGDVKITVSDWNELTSVLIALGVSIFLSCLFFVWVLKEVSEILFKNIARYLGQTFFIEEKNEETTKKWFIYHPREKDSILLGDSPFPEDAKVFRNISRSSVLEMEIHSHQIRALK